MDAKQIRENLKKNRDQKFRKRSDAQLQSIETFIHAGTLKNQDPNWLKKHSENMSKVMTKKYSDPKNRELAKQQSLKAAEKVDYAEIVTKREENGWHEKNSARYNDPDYKAKHTTAVSEANVAKASDPKWLKANREAQAKTRKPIHTHLGVFESKGEADNACVGVSVSEKLKSMPHLFYYVEDGPGETTFENVYYLDGKTGNKLRPMHREWCEVNNETPSANVNSWFNRMCKQYPNKFYSQKEPKKIW